MWVWSIVLDAVDNAPDAPIDGLVDAADRTVATGELNDTAAVG